MQKLESHLLRTQSFLKFLPLKPGVGQYIATHATLTAREFFLANSYPSGPLQWGAADAEIKVPSGENTELKRSRFKALSRLVYSNTCYAYCQEFLVYSYPPVHSPAFFQILFRFFRSCVGPQNKIGYCWMQVPVLSARGI